MAEKKCPNFRISKFTQPPAVLPLKIRRKLVKEEAELIKEWPKDAILKWQDWNLMCEYCGQKTEENERPSGTAPTPITDEDAKMLEELLGLNDGQNPTQTNNN